LLSGFAVLDKAGLTQLRDQAGGRAGKIFDGGKDITGVGLYFVSSSNVIPNPAQNMFWATSP